MRSRTSSRIAGATQRQHAATVRATSGVWSVESTRWPVSAALSAMSIVSRRGSRRRRMTSGSWRSAARSASANVRRVDADLALAHARALVVVVEELDRIFDGDDVERRGRLRCPIIAASVELLPLPAAPTTSTRPALSLGELAARDGDARALRTWGSSSGSSRSTDGEAAALPVDVDAEATELGDRVRGVVLAECSSSRRTGVVRFSRWRATASASAGVMRLDAEVDHVAA